MSAQEIIDALPQLTPADRLAIHDRLLEFDDREIEVSETERLAIEAGLHSIETGGGVPPSEARRRLAEWLAK